MIDLKSSVTDAATSVSKRISQAATDAVGAITDTVSRAGQHVKGAGQQVVDGVLSRAAKLVGSAPADGSGPAKVVAKRGKAAGKERKRARMAMRRLMKAARRSTSAV